MHLEGSCQCGAVHFSLESDSPYPYMHCHCSICRKTGGSGGYGINLGGDAKTLRVRGQKHVAQFHAVIREPGKRPVRSKALRHFCRQCGSPLWLWDARWPELVHPNASAIDTPLPKPPEVVEAALNWVAPWVDVPRGKGHVHTDTWPEESLHEWHERHGLLS
ncbi:GFA family protein [Cupriavidus pauculus]|uniref:GFA family protein n=1 Tax=Cupriavidus pauculus TaxID=82633 RepID=UPI0007849B0F|nr:GFA family protein [Cupriavidus pauculus]KAB0605254.1 GFA family protein [Cupriavidus pauculus]MCM3605158.1 GFA family protein [Cupriavidus pauculus]UAK99615.1 GFA family protein [Cupriavidus pauculus]